MIDMAQTAKSAEWLSATSRRVRDKDILRQILYRRLASEVARRLPVLLPEYLKLLMGSLLGFWVSAKLLAYFFHANPLYTLSVFGLVYSIQATYYKYRLSVDPDYKIPKCRCGGRQNENAEKVLLSTESAILRIPSSVLGVALYAALPLLVYAGRADMAMPLAIVAVLASAYLGYVMVVKIGGVCVNCINLAALNVLILWQLFG